MRIIIYIWPYINIYAIRLLRKICVFLLYMYYTHPDYWISICGKYRAYYILIFMVFLEETIVYQHT